jgi:hypothetical protein
MSRAAAYSREEPFALLHPDGGGADAASEPPATASRCGCTGSHGDCFLIAFPRKGAAGYYVMIDCA